MASDGRTAAIDRYHATKETEAGATDHLNLLADEIREAGGASDIPDERLRLMFACAYPAIDRRLSQYQPYWAARATAPLRPHGWSLIRALAGFCTVEGPAPWPNRRLIIDHRRIANGASVNLRSILALSRMELSHAVRANSGSVLKSGKDRAGRSLGLSGRPPRPGGEHVETRRWLSRASRRKRSARGCRRSHPGNRR